jgi:hypothetical protein
MKSAVGTSAVGSQSAPKQDLRAQLAEYVAQQPVSKQSFHKGMRIAEWVSLAFPVAVFAIALYLSFAWQSVEAKMIPTAWFCFPLSFTPFMLLIGFHAIGLAAFPPTGLLGNALQVSLPGAGGQVNKVLPLRVGRQALVWGWGQIAATLIGAAFWGAFTWAVWTVNMALIAVFIQVLGTLLGVVIVLRIAVSIFQKLSGAR